MELSNRAKPSVLVFTDWFEPGFKAGGPIRSTLNVVRQMKDDYKVYVITTDRDLNSSSPYTGIVVDQWSAFEGNVNVFYASPSALKWTNILGHIKNVQPDFIYLNSMYSRYFTVYPLMMKRLGLIQSKIVLAPRGMLRATAIQFKSGKKKLFFFLVKLLRMHKLIQFQATDQTEYGDILRQFGTSVNISLVPNVGAVVSEYGGRVAKSPGELRVIFVGRLHRIKNLDYLLGILPSVSGRIELTIVGSEEDKAYASECKQIAAALPANISVYFTGEKPHRELFALIHNHHVFALPTQGENFGHAIFEAMSAGKPVLISDRTPWRNLVAANAGWDIALHDKGKFINALQQAIDFNQEQYDDWSRGAWQLAHDFSNGSGIKDSYLKLFS